MQIGLHEAWGMHGLVAGDSNSVVPVGRPEDLWNNYLELQKATCWPMAQGPWFNDVIAL